jgi:hypothetical protein
MFEKRQNGRIDLGGMDIHCKMLHAPEVQVVDLSMGGGRLMSPKRLQIGAEYSFILSCNGERHTLNARVAWAKLASTVKADNGDVVPCYEVGVRFEQMFSDEAELLIQHIASRTAKKEPPG